MGKKKLPRQTMNTRMQLASPITHPPSLTEPYTTTPSVFPPTTHPPPSIPATTIKGSFGRAFGPRLWGKRRRTTGNQTPSDGVCSGWTRSTLENGAKRPFRSPHPALRFESGGWSRRLLPPPSRQIKPKSMFRATKHPIPSVSPPTTTTPRVSQSTTIHVPSLSQPATVHMPPLSEYITPEFNFTGPSPNLPFNSTSSGYAGASNLKSSKRGRGGAKGISTWGTGERFHIDFDKHGLPIGKCEQPFIGQLGLLARNGFKVSLTYARWSDLPDDVLDELWREIQDNTDAPPEFRTKCLHIIGERWREWKHYIKRHNYNIYKTDEERLSIVPDRLVADQWRTLVQYWGQDTIKSISVQNSFNRECQGGYHKMGRSSFRSIRQKMKVEGVEMDRLSVFRRTRTDKHGMIDFEAKDLIDDVNSLYEKLPEEERTAEYKEACFVKVMGEDGHGHVRTWGSGIRNPQSSEDASKSIRSQIREEVRSQFGSQIAQMKTQMDEMTRVQQNMQVLLERADIPLTQTMNKSDDPSILSSTGQVEDQHDALEDES